MKRIIALLMVLVLVSISWIALADVSFQAKTYDLGGPLDRVKLRAKPSTNSKILGQYFSGVLVQVLGTKGDWHNVIIGDREGYMMCKFLTTEIAKDDRNAQGCPGVVRYPAPEGSLPLYREPSDTSAILASMSGSVDVLGTINDDWLHVRCRDDKGRFLYGYCSSTDVTMAENFATFVVDTGEASQKLHLREAPSKDSKSLGQYFCGTKVYSLFDNHTNGDDWSKVRIGDKIGYMLSKHLDHSSGGTHNFYPPLSETLQSSVVMYDTYNGKEPVGSLSQNVPFSILGICGERYYIRIQTDNPFEYSYGYVDKNDIRSVSRSASAIGTIKSKQMLYFTGQGGQYTPTEFFAPAGAKAYIYGSVSNDGFIRSSYIDPNAEWLSCSVEIEKDHCVESVVPRDALNYDEELEYLAVRP